MTGLPTRKKRTALICIVLIGVLTVLPALAENGKGDHFIPQSGMNLQSVLSAVQNVISRIMNSENRLYLQAAAAVCGILVLLIMIMTIRHLCKPSFEKDALIRVSMDSYSADIYMSKWKKKGITLREILICGGVPVTGDIPIKAYERVVINPIKPKHGKFVIVNKAGKTALTILISGAQQTERRIKVSHESKAECVLSDRITVGLE